MIRKAFEQAAALLVDLASQIRADQWSKPGLDDWTVKELVGHAARSLTTVETYLAKPTKLELQRPVDYYCSTALRTALADAAGISARAKQAGAELGEQPAQAVRAIAERVLPLVRGAPDDAVLSTLAGGMRLIDYLPTRIFEMSVHSLDLGNALGLPVALPESAASITLQLIAEMALSQGKANELILAATGRGPLPQGFTTI